MLKHQFTNLCNFTCLEIAVLKITVKIAIYKPMQIPRSQTCRVKLKVKIFLDRRGPSLTLLLKPKLFTKFFPSPDRQNFFYGFRFQNYGECDGKMGFFDNFLCEEH